MRENERSDFVGVFKHKLDRLDEIKDSLRNGDLIESAGLYRDLLLSDHGGMFGRAASIFPELRTKRSRRFYFTVRHYATTEHNIENERMKIAQTSGVMCMHHELNGVVKYSRDDFLKIPIMCIEDDHYSFKDIIQFVSNRLGARHFDQMSGTDRQLLLHEIRDRFKVKGFDPILSPLAGKAGVIVLTGRELVDKLSNFLP